MDTLKAEYVLYETMDPEAIVITCDYDDVIVEKTKKFAKRLRMFSVLSQVSNFYIVTARENIIVDIPSVHGCQDIKKYCDDNNIKLTGIFYNTRNKIEILKLIQPHCHFEDHIATLKNCIDNGIPTMMPAEFLSPNHFIDWTEALKDNDELKYYPPKHLNLKKKLSRI